MKKPILLAIGALVIAAPAAIVLLNLGDGERVSLNSLSAAPAEIEDGESISKVHGSIRIGEGKSAGSVKNVNGSIAVERGATVESIKVVNGSIDIAESASVEESVASVNGSIDVESDVRIGEDLKSVNGRIRVEPGSEIAGELASVNGPIELRGATAGSLVTTNSDVDLADGSVILGNLTVEKPTGGFNFGAHKPPRIVIGENSEVRGKLHFEQEVELVVHESAKIGEITGVEPIRH